jgi:hypothetical protein
VTACPDVILPSDFDQVANMRTQKRKTKRGIMPKETYMETAKEISVKAF